MIKPFAPFYKFMLRVAGMAAGLCAVAVCHGQDPTFSVGFPKWGMTPRVCEYQWCTVPFEVSNPADETVNLVFSVRSANKTEAQYSKTVAVGPRASLRNSLVMVAERTNDYLATLNHADGRLIASQSIISSFQNTYQSVPLYFCSDDQELAGVSALARNKNLGAKVIVTRVPGEDMPVHLPAYGAADVVVLIRPDFPRMSASQFDALEAFVASGGTLVVLGAETIIDMETTPLFPLLPVVPLGRRLIGNFTELGQWADIRGRDSGPVWENGIDFLEVTAKPPATTALSFGDFPAMIWAQYGLGKVVAVTFDPFVEGCRDTAYGQAIWRNLISGAGHQPFGSMALFDENLDKATARLIGFSVPSIEVIRNILVTYLILIVAVLVLGTAVKKQVASWLAAAGFSLGLTFLILSAASRQLDQQAPKNAIILDLACQTSMAGSTGFCGEKLINLINREADRPDIAGQMPGVWLRPDAPAPSMMPGERNVNMMVSVYRDGGRSIMKRLDIHENKAVKIFARYEDTQQAGVGPFSLGFVDGEIRLRSPELPESIAADNLKAYLLLGAGFRRIHIKDRTFVLSADASAGAGLDPVIKDFEDYLRGARLPVPAVCLFYPAPAPDDEVLTFGDGSYDRQRYLLHLVPVSLNPGSGSVQVPAQAVVLTPAGKGARSLWWQNEWQDAFLYEEQASYLFAAQLPMEFRDMRMQEARVRLAITNSSNLVKARVEIIPLDTDGATSPSSATGIAPTRTEGETFIFEDLQKYACIHPVDGKVLVRLIVSRKVDGENTGGGKTSGKWRMAEFSVGLDGILNDRQ